MMTIEETYWASKGKYEALSAALRNLIPSQGRCEPLKGNRELDRYRRAANCYYDLYNNGLCNRAQEFRDVFGFSSKPYRNRARGSWGFHDTIIEVVEHRMDEIILKAAAEQLAKVKPVKGYVEDEA